MAKKNMTAKIIGLADNIGLGIGGLILLLVPPISALLGNLGARIIGLLLVVIALYTGYYELAGKGSKMEQILRGLTDNVLVSAVGIILVLNQTLFLQVPSWIHLVLGVFLLGWGIVTGILEIV